MAEGKTPGANEQPAPVLDSVAEDIENMQSELAGDQADQAAQGEQASEKTKSEMTDVLGMILGPGFELLAPAWNIQKQEVDALAEAYAVLIEKYFPGGLTTFGAEINAALVTIAILAPRIKMPRKIEEPPADTGGDSDAGKEQE